MARDQRPAKSGNNSVRIYEIDILPKAEKELVKIPKKIRKQVEDAIEALAGDPRPRGCKPLKGKVFAGLNRVRSGDYRIIYQVKDDVLRVIVVTVGNRKDVYR